MIGRVHHSAARESPEERFPLAPYRCPTKGGVGIRHTKRIASACPSGGIVKVVVSPAEGQVMHTPPQCVT